MSIGFRNKTKCQIKANITADATTILLNPSDYPPFLQSPGDYVFGVLRNSQNIEIVKIDVAASDEYGLSVTRAQEGTTNIAWSRGTALYQELTSETLDYLLQKAVFRTVTATPVGSLTPSYIGEKVYQSTGGPAWWKSTGLTNTDWKSIAS